MGGGGPAILLAPMSSAAGGLAGQRGDRVLELGARDAQIRALGLRARQLRLRQRDVASATPRRR